MIRAILLLFLMTLTACSTQPELNKGEIPFGKPRIHLFLYGKNKETPQIFIKAFTDAGYEVVLRNGALPTSESKSFIIHSPNINPNHFVEIGNIVKILESLGVEDLVQYQYQRGKHYYTAKNMGVYLL
ncbi:hypothetical protein P886_0774 [Alteromonadaceae bacterium 2753L.S.0a.02]|nr:hypothetical protein P886_0774 [Alteromonadaceae bacterium 2753L.S.0a.02]